MIVSRPTILILSSARWPAPARLAMAFAAEGCRVAAICAQGHPLRHVRAVSPRFHYPFLRVGPAIAAAVDQCGATLIVPTDDRAVLHLTQLHATVPGTADVIRRSLGAPGGYELLHSRYAVLRLAGAIGARVPATWPVTSKADIDRVPEPFPWALKRSGTWGGAGVRIVSSTAEAHKAVRELARSSGAIRAIKRLIVDRDGFSLASAMSGQAPEIVAQRFIRGRPANIAMVCWEGEVLTALSVQTLRQRGPTGASTVVRVIEHPGMLNVARRLAARLELSGFHGLDFILDETNSAWLIEVNPRSTQLGHIAISGRRTLAAVLAAKVAGESHENAEPPAPEGSEIALFPQAWLGDPGDPLLRTAAHDVPWEEPALLRNLLAPSWPRPSWLARCWGRLFEPDAVSWPPPACDTSATCSEDAAA